MSSRYWWRCPDCGRQISTKRGSRCRECFAYARRLTIKPPAYDPIWYTEDHLRRVHLLEEARKGM